MPNSNEQKNDNKKIIGKIIRGIIIVALLGVIAYEAVMIYRDQSEYNVAVNEYDNIRDNYVKTKSISEQHLALFKSFIPGDKN